MGGCRTACFCLGIEAGHWCGGQSFSLASLDSSLYTREPDPSVSFADSSPCRGANGPLPALRATSP